ncbi:cupin domain-containing protein [Niveibacterium sp. 24ML]|uniref:cupin domain-containing protein n=1 Tax=Niveibacterium sp. 24ML TaxID=2985512 RepID=UPI00226F8A7C|nr:cupin domain-containing protein [Niveibacterium sp. 24ML]MCX9155667.1 cupin domain-containing protein [Niveibacterium sp. 24ML]
MSALIHFSDSLPAPSPDRPRPDRLIHGNPARLTWTLHESADGLTSAGIWACEPGAWRIAFAAGKEEYFHVLEGRLRIADTAGHTREYGPGDAGLIPAGFEGSFEVIEAVRKHFVVIDRDARP